MPSHEYAQHQQPGAAVTRGLLLFPPSFLNPDFRRKNVGRNTTSLHTQNIYTYIKIITTR